MEIIAEWGTVFIVLAVIFGLYMSWGIGANDVANAMGMPVGSGAITVKQAIMIAAVMEFAGAFLAGGEVTKTIRKGIIDPTAIVGQPELLVYGMLAALLAAAIWLMVATTRGWPVSTSHTIVGAIVGFGAVGIGMDAVMWDKIAKIAASWIVSPLIGGIFALLLMISIRKLIINTENPFRNAQRWSFLYAFLVGFVVALVTVMKGLKHLRIDHTIADFDKTTSAYIWAVLVGLIIAAIARIIIGKITIDEDADREYHYASVEKIFTPLMVLTACSMAFAHGSNDVANGIGPMAAVLSIVNSGGEVAQKAALPIWVLFVGGGGIVLGLATMGYKVMQTIGTKITQLTPSRGYCATMAAASTVVFASATGAPVSTTQIAVGAVMGVGLARGVGAIDLRVIGGIVVSWLITLPAGAILAAIIFFILKAIFS
ncbi:MAG: inorganic phosphate transporter [Gammaproteobacteria bacterium]|nr:inorganic phosphate transporter [Gammaproteobacteria bacterium]